MNAWGVAAMGFTAALALPVSFAAFRGTLERFLALQLATSLATLVLVLLTFTFDQPSFTDLPLCAALLNLPGGLLIALVLERWL
jgi:hypothetical protein